MFYNNIAVSLLIAGISMICFAPFKKTTTTKTPSNANQKSQDNWTSVLKLS